MIGVRVTVVGIVLMVAMVRLVAIGVLMVVMVGLVGVGVLMLVVVRLVAVGVLVLAVVRVAVVGVLVLAVVSRVAVGVLMLVMVRLVGVGVLVLVMVGLVAIGVLMVVMVSLVGVLVLVMVRVTAVRALILLHGDIVVLMERPDALQGRQDQAIQHGSRGFEHADHPIGSRRVRVPCRREAVRAREAGFHAERGGLRRCRPHDRFHRSVPESAGREVGPVERGVGFRRAHDAESADAVPQREGDGGPDPGILGPAVGLPLRNVPGRDVGVVDGREHELRGAALRAEHEIDAPGIPRERLGKLGSGE